MNISPNVKPAVWGVFGGSVATMIVGFAWGGWVTQGQAGQLETASAKAAVVEVFTPQCVARAEQQTDQVAMLREESSWKHREFVVKAGWVDNISDYYQYDVAIACASTLVEGGSTG